ncbi:MAG: hypothetical protein AAB602_02320 [Patescibacteria group bacterium]
MNNQNDQDESRLSKECRRHRRFQIAWGIITILIVAALWLLEYRFVAVAITYWFAYRLYKMVGRRCWCGRILGVMRRNEIRKASDESVSLRSPDKHFRWWIRRVCTETFQICVCGKAVSVKLAKGPISVWHAYWVRFFDKRQFIADPDLVFVSAQASRKMGTTQDLSKHREHDTPPFVPWDPPDSKKQ